MIMACVSCKRETTYDPSAGRAISGSTLILCDECGRQVCKECATKKFKGTVPVFKCKRCAAESTVLGEE